LSETAVGPKLERLVAEKDYSSTPLTKKLGIRTGSRVLLVSQPKGFGRTLGPLPPEVELRRQARAPLDVIVVFATELSELRRRFATLARALDPSGRLWVAWPKKAAKVETDLSFEIVQRLGLEEGLVDNKSASIDDVFQGLQFVYRLRDRGR
jgi:hypothetical protein